MRVQGLIEGYSNVHNLPIFKQKLLMGLKDFWSYLNKKYKKI